MSTWRDIWRFGVIANRLYAEDENNGLKAFRKLHEVFDAGKETPDGMIHYIYGHALETKEHNTTAIEEYKRAEELFPVPHWKEVARNSYIRVQQEQTPDEYFDKSDFKQSLWCAFNKVYNFTYLNDFARYVTLSALARGSSEWPLSLVDFRTVIELEIKQCFSEEIKYYFENEERYSLKEIIDSLSFMNIISEEIAKALHSIRIGGNIAAHNLSWNPKYQTENLDAFIKSLEFFNDYIQKYPPKSDSNINDPLSQLNLTDFNSKLDEEKENLQVTTQPID